MYVDLAASAGGMQQLTVAAAQARLADLAVGQNYRVQITDVFPGKVEFLLGNQYLLATTPFKFQAGDTVTLRLVEHTAALLTFQLTLPEGASTATTGTDMATLMRAANMANTETNRAAMAQLVQAGIPVSNRSMVELAQLINTVPPEAVAAFMPLYKELIERGLHVAPEVMRQLALQSTGKPELSGLLGAALQRLREQRVSRRRKRSSLDDAVEAALTSIEREEDLPTAQALKDKLRLLYGSPEKALHDALKDADIGDGGEDPDKSSGAGIPARDSSEPSNRMAGKMPAPLQDSRPTQEIQTAHVELGDLANHALGEHIPAELAAALNMLQALRIENALDTDALEVSLPLVIDGEPTEVSISIKLLMEQYYQKDHALRIRVENDTQGIVEFQLRTRGPGLNVDVLADREETLAVYQQDMARLESEIAEGTGYFVRKISAGRQSL